MAAVRAAGRSRKRKRGETLAYRWRAGRLVVDSDEGRVELVHGRLVLDDDTSNVEAPEQFTAEGRAFLQGQSS